ncbi:hypothetical protein DPMN_170586 [Dreissena polymorpha]|uniref:Uncharacterized protein n=1 Tax=Dreissena polymorpha TaxID=45954 RepID=A0A9D4DXB2_DREPO|nr:hypothetical protein DPMN_170586 [Dreissena polymorpha]
MSLCQLRHVSLYPPKALVDVMENRYWPMRAHALDERTTLVGGHTWVRFNESDHSRATMVVQENNHRATITGFNRERRSSVDRALFDILSSDRSPPLTPRLLVA